MNTLILALVTSLSTPANKPVVDIEILEQDMTKSISIEIRTQSKAILEREITKIPFIVNPLHQSASALKSKLQLNNDEIAILTALN